VTNPAMVAIGAIPVHFTSAIGPIIFPDDSFLATPPHFGRKLDDGIIMVAVATAMYLFI